MIEFYGPISWCDSWQWLGKRGGKNTTTQHWLGELYSEQRNEFRISLNQASIIIAINTIRKYVPFFDMTAFIKCKNRRKCKHTHTHKHKHKQSKRIEFSLATSLRRWSIQLHCFGRWIYKWINQSDNRVKLMPTLATWNCFHSTYADGNLSMQSFTIKSGQSLLNQSIVSEFSFILWVHSNSSVRDFSVRKLTE